MHAKYQIIEAAVTSLKNLGFFAGLSPAEAESVANRMRAEVSLLVDSPRVFELNFRETLDCDGTNLVKLVARSITLIGRDPRNLVNPLSPNLRLRNTEGRVLAKLIGSQINAQIEYLGLPDRLYLFDFDVQTYGALLTPDMAAVVKDTGSVDPEAATIYRPE